MHNVLLSRLLLLSTNTVHLLASSVNATWRTCSRGICDITSVRYQSTPECVVYRSKVRQAHAPASMSLPCGSDDGSSLSTVQPALLAALCVGGGPSCWSVAFLNCVCLLARPGIKWRS